MNETKEPVVAPVFELREYTQFTLFVGLFIAGAGLFALLNVPFNATFLCSLLLVSLIVTLYNTTFYRMYLELEFSEPCPCPHHLLLSRKIKHMEEWEDGDTLRFKSGSYFIKDYFIHEDLSDVNTSHVTVERICKKEGTMIVRGLTTKRTKLSLCAARFFENRSLKKRKRKKRQESMKKEVRVRNQQQKRLSKIKI